MSINREMVKEDMVHIYNAVLLSHKKNEIMPLQQHRCTQSPPVDLLTE